MDTVRFVNLTEHEVIIQNKRMGDMELALPPSGMVARVDSSLVRREEFREHETGVLVPAIAFTDHYVYNLPDPVPGFVYVVSKAVREALPWRMDLASPDVTAKESVWREGKIHSVPGLVVNYDEEKIKWQRS